MSKKVLTAAAIKRLKAPESGQAEYFDAALPGFAVRVTSKGTKSFICFYRFGGKLRRETLGRYPVLSLQEARDKARAIHHRIDAGQDPKLERAEQKAETERARQDTYKAAVEDFIAKYAIGKKANRRHAEQKRLLLKANEFWHDRPVSSITRREIHDVLDEQMAAGKPYAANRTYAALGTFFRWLHGRDRVTENLMLKVQRPFDGETARQRVWSDKEIKAIWKNAETLQDDERDYVRLLLLLGQRRNEIAGMRWDEIDLEAKAWTLTVDRAKGKREHTFPLPDLAARILKGRPQVENNPFVFPGRGTHDGEPSPMTIGTKIQTRIKRESGVSDFAFHDARRTLRTGLDKLQIPPHVKDECLNHARRGVGDVHYSGYDYLDEQREAFDAWAAHIEGLVHPKGVVGLRG